MNDRVVQTLQRLMAKEASLRGIGRQAELNEAEAIAEKVAELMLRHQIEMTEVERTQHEAEQPIESEVYVYAPSDTYRPTKRTAWEVGLATAVARAHNCRILIGHGYLVFVGRADERAVAMQMFRILRTDLTNATDDGYRAARRIGENTKGYMSSFMTAAVSRIQKRYHDMRVRVVAETQSTALVLVEDTKLDSWVADNSGPRVVTKRRGGDNYLGYDNGAKFGENVSLNSKAVGSSGRPAKQLGSAS